MDMDMGIGNHRIVIKYRLAPMLALGLVMVATACSNQLGSPAASGLSEDSADRPGVIINGGALGGQSGGNSGAGDSDESADSPPEADFPSEVETGEGLRTLSLEVEFESQATQSNVQSVTLSHCPATDAEVVGLTDRFAKEDCGSLALSKTESSGAKATFGLTLATEVPSIPLENMHDLKWKFHPKANSNLGALKLVKSLFRGKHTTLGTKAIYQDLNPQNTSQVFADKTFVARMSRSAIRVQSEMTPSAQSITVVGSPNFLRRSVLALSPNSFAASTLKHLKKTSREDLDVRKGVVTLNSASSPLGAAPTEVSFDGVKFETYEPGSGISRSGESSSLDVSVGGKVTIDLEEVRPGLQFFPVR
jgi:hypothetical protein